MECLHGKAADPERVLVGAKELAEVIDNPRPKLIALIINNLHGVD